MICDEKIFSQNRRYYNCKSKDPPADNLRYIQEIGFKKTTLHQGPPNKLISAENWLNLSIEGQSEGF
jgi:hypothetical protein